MWALFFTQTLVLATYLMDLLISSVMQIKDRSSFSSLIGIVAGAAARILHIKRPFANVVKRF